MIAQHRIIYALRLLVDPGGGRRTNEIVELIAPLDPAGQSPYIEALPPKGRVIDLRAGDYLRHKGLKYRVKTIAAFSDTYVSDEYLAGRAERQEGYLVRNVPPQADRRR